MSRPRAVIPASQRRRSSRIAPSSSEQSRCEGRMPRIDCDARPSAVTVILRHRKTQRRSASARLRRDSRRTVGGPGASAPPGAQHRRARPDPRQRPRRPSRPPSPQLQPGHGQERSQRGCQRPDHARTVGVTCTDAAASASLAQEKTQEKTQGLAQEMSPRGTGAASPRPTSSRPVTRSSTTTSRRWPTPPARACRLDHPGGAGSGTHICGVVVGCRCSALTLSSAVQLHAPEPARVGQEVPHLTAGLIQCYAAEVPPMSFWRLCGLPVDEGSAPCARSSFARS
ncbi:hypothetical protein SO3561_08718 [Streptomyces olivochromogenes]|uniref:Uncharacterized protein n=1 Tax=Streptomyces olivochromogenes TaxID=1963 RepID=A0A250VSD7_STROL|nr:hypothetical protein SO3561_08718 [Streptomyces olivochromogenes]